MSTIELSHLTFTYPERSFSLDVEDKHFADPMVAIVGQNGAGKSTLLKRSWKIYRNKSKIKKG